MDIREHDLYNWSNGTYAPAPRGFASWDDVAECVGNMIRDIAKLEKKVSSLQGKVRRLQKKRQ